MYVFLCIHVWMHVCIYLHLDIRICNNTSKLEYIYREACVKLFSGDRTVWGIHTGSHPIMSRLVSLPCLYTCIHVFLYACIQTGFQLLWENGFHSFMCTRPSWCWAKWITIGCVGICIYARKYSVRTGSLSFYCYDVVFLFM
jgi:hypothetical protein